MGAEYSYFAWLEDEDNSVDKARVVIRTSRSPEGYEREEMYIGDSRWEISGLQDDFRTNHMRGWLKPITEADARRFEEIVAERARRSS